MPDAKCRMVNDDDTECGKPAVARVFPKTAGGRWVPMCEEHVKEVPENHPDLRIERIEP